MVKADGGHSDSRGAVFQEYAHHILPYNPGWLKNAPAWCRNVRLSSDRLVNRTKKWSVKHNWNTYLDELKRKELISCPATIVANDVYGHHLVSTREILPGEVIVVEPPLLLALKAKSPPCCLHCYKETQNFTCPECGFYFCGTECLTAKHEEECRILAGLELSTLSQTTEESQIRKRLSLMPEQQRLQAQALLQKAKAAALKQRQQQVIQHYGIVTVAKTLLTISQCDYLRKAVLSLQGNFDKETKRYSFNQKHIVDIMLQKLQIKATPEFLHRICSIWDTNGFEVPLGSGTHVHGLYTFASLLTHDCQSNTQQWFTSRGELVLRSVDYIRPNQMITTCYTDPKWATLIRQEHLKVSKNFTCSCQRCADSTELGTYFGSPRCWDCEGLLASSAPLDPEADWICTSGCPCTATGKEVVRAGYRVSQTLQDLEYNDPEAVRILSQRLQGVLHPTHQIVFQLNVTIVSRLASKDLSGESDDALKNLLSVTTSVNNTLRALQAPLTRLSARMCREHLRVKMECLRRDKARGLYTEGRLQELRPSLKQCKLVLGWDSGLPSVQPLLQLYQDLLKS